MTTKEFQLNLIDLQESLMRFAYILTADKEDAKDLVQETTLKALKYADSFVIKSNFKAWTYTIMKNTFINNYRRGSLHNTNRDKQKQTFFITEVLSDESYEADASYSEIEITHAIEQLREMHRVPFKLHIYGYKYKEIAEELNLKIGTVKSRIFLSRKILKDQLER